MIELLPFVLVAFAQDWSYAEEQNALMYLQSHLAPVWVEHCKTTFPDEAEALDEVLEKWEKANKRAISKGKKAYLKIEKISEEEGVEQTEAEISKMEKELAAEPMENRRETCDKIVEVLERESR